MSNDEIVRRLDLLTSAIHELAQVMGARLNREQLSARLGVHRNTLAKRIREPRFPLPDKHGRWLLADVIQWERNNSGWRV